MRELENIGLNQGTISTVGCIIFIGLGALGQCDQIRRIRRTKSATNVSMLMNIIMTTLFASYLIRGLAEAKLMYVIQGTVRTALFIPIVVGIAQFAGVSRANVIQGLVAIVLLTSMALQPHLRVPGFIMMMYAGVAGAAMQAWKIRHSTGQVSYVFYLTMLMSVSFQTWYGWYFKDTALLVTCMSFVIVYTIVLLIIAKNTWHKK